MADGEGLFGFAKRIVPSSARFYTQTMFGDKTKSLTQNDLTTEELKYLNDVIQTSRVRLQQKIETIKNAKKFSDLPAEVQNQTIARLGARQNLDAKSPEEANLQGQKSTDYFKNALKDAKSKALFNEKQIQEGLGNVQYEDYDENNPIKNTLGRFTYKINPDGSIKVSDFYDFINPAREYNVEEFKKMNTTEKIATLAKTGVLNIGDKDYIKGMAGKIGEAFLGAEGRPINITYNPNMLSQQNSTIEQQPMYTDPFGNTIGSSIR
jgi:hypothetical protein